MQCIFVNQRRRSSLNNAIAFVQDTSDDEAEETSRGYETHSSGEQQTLSSPGRGHSGRHEDGFSDDVTAQDSHSRRRDPKSSVGIRRRAASWGGRLSLTLPTSLPRQRSSIIAPVRSNRSSIDRMRGLVPRLPTRSRTNSPPTPPPRRLSPILWRRKPSRNRVARHPPRDEAYKALQEQLARSRREWHERHGFSSNQEPHHYHVFVDEEVDDRQDIESDDYVDHNNAVEFDEHTDSDGGDSQNEEREYHSDDDIAEPQGHQNSNSLIPGDEIQDAEHLRAMGIQALHRNEMSNEDLPSDPSSVRESAHDMPASPSQSALRRASARLSRRLSRRNRRNSKGVDQVSNKRDDDQLSTTSSDQGLELDPVLLSRIKPDEPVFVFTRPNGLQVTYRLESLIDYMLFSGHFREPETNLEFSESDLEEIDHLAEKYSLSKESVLGAKRRPSLFDDRNFTANAILGLERCCGEAVGRIPAVLEQCQSHDRAHTVLVADIFPTTRYYFEQIAFADAEYAAMALEQYASFVNGPPNRPVEDPNGLLPYCNDFLRELARIVDIAQRRSIAPVNSNHSPSHGSRNHHRRH